MKETLTSSNTRQKAAFVFMFLWAFAYFRPAYWSGVQAVKYACYGIKLAGIWWIVWKEVLKLTPEGVSRRTSDLLCKSFHTEERLKCGVLPMDGLCRRKAAWGLGWKTKWNRYDGLVLAIGALVLASGIRNTEVAVETGKNAFYFMLMYFGMRKMLMQEEDIRRSLFHGFMCYFVLTSLVSTIFILAVGGQSYGHYFFWGSDNGMANNYFFAVFLAYIDAAFDKKRVSLPFILAAASAVVYAFTLQVGAAMLWVLGGGVFAVLFCIPSKMLLKIMDLSHLLIGFLLLWLSIFVSRWPLMENLINKIFYGKYSSITSRAKLWEYFLGRSLSHPLLGYGSSAVKYQSLPEGIDKWKLIGNCHNICVETIYHYGYAVFLLLLVLIFLVADRLRKQGRKYVYLGVFFFLYLLHGLVESGVNYSFLYLPLMYYAEKMERQNER